MEKISLTYFYNFGSVLHPVAAFEYDRNNRVRLYSLCYSLESYVRGILEYYVRLKVCRIPGINLINAISEIRKWFHETPSDKWSSDNFEADMKSQDVIAKAKEFETILSAELQTLITYHPSQKGIYSTTDLVEQAEKIFPESVLSKLDDKIIKDIRESGKCLAFGNDTASAFHMMRATESVLHYYYIHICNPSPKPKKRLESWGSYITNLQSSSKSGVKEVIAILQQIKDQHRNLIMHPEVFLSPEDSFTLFEISQAAIMAMANSLPTRKKKVKKTA